MAVDSVASSTIDLTASYGVKSQQEKNETPHNDNDEQAAKSAQATVNTSGQTVGVIINAEA